MAAMELTVEQVRSMLAETSRRIAALTAGRELMQLHVAPSPGEWSVNDVLAHLRSCADVWGDAIRRIITEDMPVIRAIDPRAWTMQTEYPKQEFLPSLEAFTTQRFELLATLDALPPEGWERAATVKGAGKPLTRTVLGYASRLARQRARRRRTLRGCAPCSQV